jgi:phosphoglycolate phosphatase
MTARRLIVFDVDGTLIDSQRHIMAAMTHAFTVTGHSVPTLTEVLAIVGLSLPEAVARLAPQLDPETRDAIVSEYKHSFMTDRIGGAVSPLYSGAGAALDRLTARDDIVLGIATGKSRRGLDHVLRAHGLSCRFATEQVADDHPSKPHPAMLFAALADTRTGPADAVIVGDTTYDIDMGHAAGIRTIGVAWGYHGGPALRAAAADLVIDRFDDLDTALAALWVPA